MTDQVVHADIANAISAWSMDAVEQAKSGHPGMPMSIADVATVLFGHFLKFNEANPDWTDRDYGCYTFAGMRIGTSTPCAVSGDWAPTPPDILNMATGPGLKQKLVRWVRALPMPSALHWVKPGTMPVLLMIWSITAPRSSRATVV